MTTATGNKRRKYYSCSACGKRTKSEDVKVRADGSYVCPACAEDDVKFIKETISETSSQAGTNMATATAAQKTIKQQTAEIWADGMVKQLKLRGVNATAEENGRISIPAGKFVLRGEMISAEELYLDGAVGYSFRNDDIDDIVETIKARAKGPAAVVDLRKASHFLMYDIAQNVIRPVFTVGPNDTVELDGWRVTRIEFYADGLTRLFNGDFCCVREMILSSIEWEDEDNGTLHRVKADHTVPTAYADPAMVPKGKDERPKATPGVHICSPDEIPGDVAEKIAKTLPAEVRGAFIRAATKH